MINYIDWNSSDGASHSMDKPCWSSGYDKLRQLRGGVAEHFHLYMSDQSSEQCFSVIGKPGIYQISIFIGEDEQYLFQSGEQDEQQVDIDGNYWPTYLVCTSFCDLVEVAREFFITGQPASVYQWLHLEDE